MDCKAVKVQEVLQRRQEPLRWGTQWPAIRSRRLRAITDTVPLTTTQEAVEELIVDHSMIVQYVKQTGKVKKLGKWVPCELTEYFKTGHFEVLSSLIL